MLRKLLIALFAVSLFGIARAQTVATGLYPYGSFDALGFDSIDRGSLNVHFSLPIFTKVGRRLPFQYSLVYDGLIWSPASVNGATTWTPASSFGLHGALLNEGYKGFLSYNVIYQKCYVGGTLQGTFPIYRNYVYHDQFGTNHAFNFTSNTCTGVDTGDGSTADGSGYTLGGAIVYSPQGTKLTLPTFTNGAVSTMTGSISDTNGNQISNDQNGTFTDTTGVHALTVTGGATAASPKVFAYPIPGGSASATLSYRTYTVEADFGCGVGKFNQTIDLADRLTLADGSYYQFAYEATPGNAPNVTGRLSSITLPAGGRISYSYSVGVNCADGTPLNLTRTTTDGTKTYYRSSITATSSHTEIKDGAGNFSEIDFVTAGSPIAYYPTLEADYAGAATGTPLLKRGTCYNGAAPPCVTTTVAVPISQIDTYETLNGTEEHGSKVLYNSNGLQTERDDYDFAVNARGALLQRELWSYPTSGIAGLLSTDTVYDGSGNQVSQVGYGYDQSPVTPTSGLPQHAGPIGSQRGNLTYMGEWLNTSTVNMQLQSNTYDDAGQLLTSSGPANAGITRYGHDATDTFVTSTNLPTPSSGVALTTTASYDLASGVLLSNTDANGQTTSYGNYDAMNRAQTVTYPDTGRTQYAFSPTQLVAYHDLDSAHLTVTDYVLQYDGYGRNDRFAQANGQSPNAWYQEDYCYDANGRLGFQPVPYQNTGFSAAKLCSGNGYTTTYDALDRPLQAINVNTATTYSYNGRATQVTDAYGVTKIQQRDGIGNLAAVCEVSSTVNVGVNGTPADCKLDIAASGFLTTYTTNLANHTVVASDGGQARLVGTDSLGRMTTLQEPEIFTGNSSTLTTFGYAYNATGLQVTRTKPRANQTNQAVTTTTTTQYDLLGRVVSVSYSDGTPTKTFTYDSFVQDGTWTRVNVKGRLSTAATSVTGQQVPPSAVEYSYDPVGRVVGMWECQPSSCGITAKTRELDFSYDLAGRLLSQADPTTGAVHYSYSPAGEITSISNSVYNNVTNPGTYVSGITNGPAGPTSYHLGNGLTVVGTYDSANRIQYRWLCAGGVTTSYCSGGTQLYGLNTGWQGSYLINSIDTVMNTGGNYTYDDLGRLKSFASNAGVSSTFSWTYDRWGNRWSQTPGASVTFDTSNHKLDGSTMYDAAGNMIKDASHQYAYDAEGNLLSVDNGVTASYVYNALNQRVQVNVPGAPRAKLEFTYDFAGRRVTTWDATANAGIQGQVWWGSMPIAYRDIDGTTRFQHSDWVGTQRVLTDYAGNVLSQYKSNPFGDGYTASGQDDNSLHYGQLEHDAASGSEHAQFRQFDSAVGIWMSPDPYLGSYDFTNPQSLNRYTYALNNPLGSIDPNGLRACDLGPSGDCLYSNGGGNLDAGSDAWDGYSASDPSAYYAWGSYDPSGSIESSNLPISGYDRQFPMFNLGSLLGLSNPGCEFGACGGVVGSFTGGGGNPTMQIKSLYENILEHLEKLAADPNNPAAEHWNAEIENWSKQILKKAAKRPGDVDKYLQRIIGISGSDLENILGSPSIIVNPCITNPLAPYCNQGPYNGPA